MSRVPLYSIPLGAAALALTACASVGAPAQAPAPAPLAWTWMAGATQVGDPGVVSDPPSSHGNHPGAREAVAAWAGAGGSLWVFGGFGLDPQGQSGLLSDLWQYDPAVGLWHWTAGPSAPNTPGVYGTLGVAAAGNTPGARSQAASAASANGPLWLYGGSGLDGQGTSGNLADLWSFDPATAEWTWVAGSASAQPTPGVYGSRGVSAAANHPGPRYGASLWVDGQGHVWLFGGYGISAQGTPNFENDLWEFDPATHDWTWVSGSPNGGAIGVYGTQGTASPANTPGGRYFSAHWTDSQGRLWLFGGDGFDGAQGVDELNDLWRFDPATRLWTWVSGASTIDAAGDYGTQNVAAATNVPGARFGASGGVANGRFVLFGGNGIDAADHRGLLSDAWQFNPVNDEWTWVQGPNTVQPAGVYSTQGTASFANGPGGRDWSGVTVNTQGAVWLFGGFGADASGNLGDLDDLWVLR